MARKFKTYFLFLLCISIAISNLCAQKNLVKNPSFEEKIKTKPTKSYNHVHSPDAELVEGWFIPNAATSDYYNSNYSTINGSPIRLARTGEGRIGLVLKEKTTLEYSEYIETKLIKPLEEGKKYFVRMYFCIDKRTTFSAQSIGMCFTQEKLLATSNTTLPKLSQVTCNEKEKLWTQEGWSELSGIYEAQGGEEYLTIGNFDTRGTLPIKNNFDRNKLSDNDLQSIFKDYAYYYIDDVCVEEIIDSTNTECCKDANSSNAEKSFNNFVFMVDISSSMIKGGFLEDVKKSVIQFIDTLGKNDLVSLLTFDGNTYVLFKKIKASEKEKITEIVSKIVAGTSTNIDKAVSTAYYIIENSFIHKGNNRVILASDAIFKLSKKSRKTIKHYNKKKDVAFTMIQFGNQTNKDLEKICKKTDGNYSNTKNQDMNSVLVNQIEKPIINEYTKERKGLIAFKKIARVLLVGTLIGLYILVKTH